MDDLKFLEYLYQRGDYAKEYLGMTREEYSTLSITQENILMAVTYVGVLGEKGDVNSGLERLTKDYKSNFKSISLFYPNLFNDASGDSDCHVPFGKVKAGVKKGTQKNYPKAARVKELIKDKEWSMNRACKHVDISPRTYNRINKEMTALHGEDWFRS